MSNPLLRSDWRRGSTEGHIYWSSWVLFLWKDVFLSWDSFSWMGFKHNFLLKQKVCAVDRLWCSAAFWRQLQPLSDRQMWGLQPQISAYTWKGSEGEVEPAHRDADVLRTSALHAEVDYSSSEVLPHVDLHDSWLCCPPGTASSRAISTAANKPPGCCPQSISAGQQGHWPSVLQLFHRCHFPCLLFYWLLRLSLCCRYAFSEIRLHKTHRRIPSQNKLKILKTDVFLLLQVERSA